MTKERSAETPSLSPSPTNMSEILLARGHDIDFTTKCAGILLEGSGSVGGKFLTHTQTSPGSPFGQFVTVVSTEIGLAVALGQLVRKMTDRNQFKVLPMVKSLQNVLGVVREVRKEIGEEIFGEESDNYAQKVNERLTRGPTGSSRLEERITWQRELSDEVRERFPLTSR